MFERFTDESSDAGQVFGTAVTISMDQRRARVAPSLREASAVRKEQLMLALAHHFDEPVEAEGMVYRARVYGSVEADGRWAGWAVFFPARGGRVIATARETTQSTLEHLTYWASGLTHTYLRGALERALALQPEEQLARELQRLERLEQTMEQEAKALETAASLARREAGMAEAERERTEKDLLASLADAAEEDAAALDTAAEESRERVQAAEEAPRSPSRRRK